MASTLTVYYAYRTRIIGQTSSPTSDLYYLNSIQGLSRAKGDASDTTAANGTQGPRIGWLTGNREELVLLLAMPSDVPRGGLILSATLDVVVGMGGAGGAGSFNSDIVPTDGTQLIEMWAVRQTLTSALANLTWANYASGAAWSELGIHFGVGSDTDSVRIGTLAITQAQYDVLKTTGLYDLTIDIRSEMQFILDTDQALQLAFRALWPASNPGVFRFANPRDLAVGQTRWGFITLNYKKPLEVYGSLGGSINLVDLKDASAADKQEHLYLGTPPKGSLGSTVKYFVRNEIADSQPAIVVHSGDSQISSIDNTAVAGSGLMRWAEPYTTTSSNVTPSVKWKLTFTAATTADVSISTDNGATYITTGITSPTGIDITADRVIVYNSKNALQLRTAAFTGTFAAADVVTWDTRGDLHDLTTHPIASLDDVYITPHAVGDRSSAFTSKPSAVRYSKTCQLWAGDTAAIANSSPPSSGVIGNVSGDGDNDGTHIKVPYTGFFRVGDYGTLATFGAADEPAGAQRVERVQIANVYAMDDATYPGQIGFVETLTSPSDYDVTSIFTTGVWIGELAKPDQRFLALTASTGSAIITLDSPLEATAGIITLLDLVGGKTETRTIDHVTGNDIVLTGAPSYAYPIGTLVYFASETDTNCPFFMYANPPATATRGRKQGYIAFTSFAVTAI